MVNVMLVLNKEWMLVLIVTELLKPSFTKEDVCADIKACKCHSDVAFSDGIQIVCTNATSQDISRIPLHRFTTVRIQNSSLEYLSVLSRLRNSTIPKGKNLSLLRTQISVFNWSWIPSHGMERIRLMNTGTFDMYARKTPTLTNQFDIYCNMNHIKELHGLWISNQSKLRSVPSCLPDVIRLISIWDSPLTNLKKRRRGIQWPKMLQTLELGNNSLQSITDQTFPKPLPDLKVVCITLQNFSTGTIFQKIPSEALINLTVQSSQLHHISTEDLVEFRKHNKLRTLKLSFNLLKQIPPGIPPSVRFLYLDNNRISAINSTLLSGLKNLEMLSLKYNQLDTVPAGMPNSMKLLELQHNQIISTDPHAFIYMTQLASLNLGYNRLSSMPQNIPFGIKSYSVENNNIDFIGTPTNYEFCFKCTLFNISGNPWTCDQHMLNFLVWANLKRRITGLTLGHMNSDSMFSCRDTVMENVELGKILRYMDEVTKLGCSYNVNALNCTRTAMTKYPHLMKGLLNAHINDNLKIGNVPDDLFATQNRLKILELNTNSMTRIPCGLPKSIEILSLKRNKITHLTSQDEESLRSLIKLNALYLDENQLKTMHFTSIAPLRDLNWLGLKGNPLICDCTIWPLVLWLGRKQNEINTTNMANSSAICTGPRGMEGREIALLTNNNA